MVAGIDIKSLEWVKDRRTAEESLTIEINNVPIYNNEEINTLQHRLKHLTYDGKVGILLL